MPNSISPDLIISPVSLKDTGFYICRVNCGDAFEFSQWTQVDVLNANTPWGTLSQFLSPAPPPSTRSNESDDTSDVPCPPGQCYHSPEGRLKLVIQPKLQRLQVGENLQLECAAVGRPIPRYQWHRNGVPLPNATKRKLVVSSLLF